MLSIRKQLSKLDWNGTQMDYDATSLYPSAMWVEKSIFPKIETRFAFQPDLNAVYVEAFNNQTINQDGDESAILKMEYHNLPNLVFQHLPVEEKIK